MLIARDTNLEPIQNELSQYTCQNYKLNAWFPEEYKTFNALDTPGFAVGTHRFEVPWLRFDLIGQTLSNPDNRLRLLKFLLYRQAPGDTGARGMVFCINKEIPALGPAPLGGVPAATAPQAAAQRVAAQPAREAVLQSQPDGSHVYGKDADGRPVLVDPKNVAAGPDGKLYVVEGKPARVTVFNPDGTIATSWGGPGQGDQEGESQAPHSSPQQPPSGEPVPGSPPLRPWVVGERVRLRKPHPLVLVARVEQLIQSGDIGLRGGDDDIVVHPVAGEHPRPGPGGTPMPALLIGELDASLQAVGGFPRSLREWKPIQDHP